MLRGLTNYSTLQRRPITSFGGLQRGEETEVNEFSDMQGMSGSGRGTLSSCGALKKAAAAVGTGQVLAVENGSSMDFYSLGEGGFYKNGTLLPLKQFGLGTSIGVPSGRMEEVKARCQELGLPVEISVTSYGYLDSTWIGDYQKTKLVRYGNFVIAVPQMLITDGINTYFWKGHFFLMQDYQYYSDLELYYPGLTGIDGLFPDGEAITVRLNGHEFLTGYTKVDPDKTMMRKLVPEGKTGSGGGGKALAEVLRPGMVNFTDVTHAYNRMFGVSGNRIYASKQGDIHNFNYYKLTPLDSWWADTESGEDFTALTSLSGRVVAFKKMSTYEVYGVNAPYTVKDVSRSFGCVNPFTVAEVAGVLVLQTKEGLHAYGGSRFVNIQYPLGDLLPEADAMACGTGSKYYIVMAGRLYCYDYYRGAWYCVSGETPAGLCTCAGGVFINLNGTLWQLPESDSPAPASQETKEQPWYFETTAINRDFTEGLLSSVELKLACEDASFTVWVSHDGGAYEKVQDVEWQQGKRFVAVPVRPRMCAEFRVKVAGSGRVTLCGMMLNQYKGGSVSLCSR